MCNLNLSVFLISGLASADTLTILRLAFRSSCSIHMLVAGSKRSYTCHFLDLGRPYSMYVVVCTIALYFLLKPISHLSQHSSIVIILYTLWFVQGWKRRVVSKGKGSVTY